MKRSRWALYAVLAIMGAALAWLTRPTPEAYLPGSPVAERGVRQSLPAPGPAGSGGSASSAGAAEDTALADVPSGQTRAPAALSDADPLAPDTAETPEDTAEALTHRLAQSLYARSGRQFVASQIEQGLAEADSIVIVRQAMDRIAACVVDALRAEAEEQSLRFDVLLLALEAVLSDADVPEAEAMLTTSTIEARTVPCVYAVAQEAGIAVP